MLWPPYDDNGEPISFPAVPTGQSLLFQPVGEGGDWRLNAIVDHFHEDDGVLGFAYADAAKVLVDTWVTTRSANDLHLMPIIWLYRHALELDLKACIRLGARCVELDGARNPADSQAGIGEWFRQDARHQLVPLADRLDSYLLRLGEDVLPSDVRAVLIELHQLDPGGDNFRYSTKYDRVAKAEVQAARPDSYHVDISRLGGILEQAHGFLSGGVYSWLHEALQSLYELNRDCSP